MLAAAVLAVGISTSYGQPKTDPSSDGKFTSPGLSFYERIQQATRNGGDLRIAIVVKLFAAAGIELSPTEGGADSGLEWTVSRPSTQSRSIDLHFIVLPPEATTAEINSYASSCQAPIRTNFLLKLALWTSISGKKLEPRNSRSSETYSREDLGNAVTTLFSQLGQAGAPKLVLPATGDGPRVTLLNARIDRIEEIRREVVQWRKEYHTEDEQIDEAMHRTDLTLEELEGKLEEAIGGFQRERTLRK